MIRTSDETIEPAQRTKLVKDAFGSGSDVIVVSNHINAGGGDGAEVIYALRNDDKLSSLIANELEKEGQNVRKYYQRRLPSDPSKDYYFMLRDTGDTESIIVEYGFLDSPLDDPAQLKNNYEAYAEAVVRALANYIGATYVPVVGSDYYVVQKGDSLWSISKKFNTTVEKLKDLNNLSTNTLNVGQVLKLPTENLQESDEYIVQAGDTLYKISSMFNISVQELMALNNLSSTNLSIGQKLKVAKKDEENYSDKTVYTVVKGDTLYQIAQKYNVSVQDIIDANNLVSTSLSIGQKLLIPTSNNKDTLYTVVSGDSLYKIANQYGVTVDEIKKLNNLTSNLLSIGQVLKIPSRDNYTVYVVQAGDSLYGIARKYGTTVSDLQSVNNLASSNLSIGQKLLIPAK